MLVKFLLLQKKKYAKKLTRDSDGGESNIIITVHYYLHEIIIGRWRSAKRRGSLAAAVS